MRPGTVLPFPLCFAPWCRKEVTADPYYASPCGCDARETRHPVAVWHGVCLAEWAEKRDQAHDAFQRMLRRMADGGN
jgi:hypothetical protein